MSHTCMSHVTWLMQMYHVSHMYMTHICQYLQIFFCIYSLIYSYSHRYDYVSFSDSFVCVTFTDSFVCVIFTDSFVCVIFADSFVCVIFTDSFVCVTFTDSFVCVTFTRWVDVNESFIQWLIHMCHIHCDTYLIWMCNSLTHSYVSYPLTHSYVPYSSTHSHMSRSLTLSSVWHSRTTSYVWHTLTHNDTHCFSAYGVITISRLLRIKGLFCKRALYKRLYSAKETYNFKEPTNRSHPIVHLFSPQILSKFFEKYLSFTDQFAKWDIWYSEKRPSDSWLI